MRRFDLIPIFTVKPYPIQSIFSCLMQLNFETPHFYPYIAVLLNLYYFNQF
jgi:hypothetical protein